jgi:rSAM/selenodomain-associated transferase 1
MGCQYQVLDSASGVTANAFCALAVIVKAPRAGSVKTRLVPPLRPDEAAALNACFLRDVAAVIETACAAGVADGYVAYTPLGQEASFDGLLPDRFRLLSQRGTNLGERLFHASEDFFAFGYRGVCLINSDGPTLPVAVLVEAVNALRESGDRVVLGPADDGGYYLIGLKRAHPQLFEDIAWSTDSVLASTLDRAREIALETRLLPSWYDVDDARSLGRLFQELFTTNCREMMPGYSAPHTREYLQRLIKADGGKRLGLTPTQDAANHSNGTSAPVERVSWLSVKWRRGVLR